TEEPPASVGQPQQSCLGPAHLLTAVAQPKGLGSLRGLSFGADEAGISPRTAAWNSGRSGLFIHSDEPSPALASNSLGRSDLTFALKELRHDPYTVARDLAGSHPRPPRDPDAPVPVRDRHREQLSDDPERPRAPGPDGGVRSLPAL